MKPVINIISQTPVKVGNYGSVRLSALIRTQAGFASRSSTYADASMDKSFRAKLVSPAEAPLTPMFQWTSHSERRLVTGFIKAAFIAW
jgi:hypothetical protein